MKRKIHRYHERGGIIAQQLDELIFARFGQIGGEENFQRMQTIQRYYDYYNGKQHKHPDTGNLVRAEDLPRPDGLDYDPTRYSTNYFKSFIQRKARWQFGGKHGITVKPKEIDERVEMSAPDYEPSPAQETENQRAEFFEDLIYQLWDENNMREQLLKGARDRLIAGNVAIKILFNPRTGKLRWIFRPDNEVVPIYSDDDFNDLIGTAFITHQPSHEEGMPDNIRIQLFSLDENGMCWIEEKVYDQDLNVVNTIQESEPMNIDFLPVVMVPVSELTADSHRNGEIEDMMELTSVLNQMSEDAIDGLKFEMFPITAFLNVPVGTIEKTQIAPGSMVEVNATMIEGVSSPRIEKIESQFRWGEAFDEQYSRVKSALHDITNLPNIVPQELNFGGLNGEALHVLFHSIIQETEEHWIVWDARLRELHEKSIKYLQARTSTSGFQYDRSKVRGIGDDYDHEINFVLPLPDNRQELVAVLTDEVLAGFESSRGAIERLGTEDVDSKLAEIRNEKQQEQKERMDIYDRHPGNDNNQNL